MSATPIEPKYMLEQLRHLPITEIVWSQQKEVKVISAQTSHPDRYVMRLCREALEQSHINVHIFVNSVKFIAKIINTLQLPAKDVKIVCSQSGTFAIRMNLKIFLQCLLLALWEYNFAKSSKRLFIIKKNICNFMKKILCNS